MSLLIETVAATAGSLAALAGATAYATLNAQSQIFGKMLVAPPEPWQVALTFDDGPNPAATPRLLEVLARHKVRATFFVIGSHAVREPALTREILAAGHALGNHTMTHLWLARYSEARIRDEIARCQGALEDIAGAPIGLFRPPHGARRPAVLRIARELGLTTVGWNIIAGDWKQPEALDLYQRLERRILKREKRGRGTNIVLHDGGQHEFAADRMRTVAAVEMLLDGPVGESVFVVPPEWGEEDGTVDPLRG